MTLKEDVKKALDGLAQFIIMNDTGTDESASAIEWHGILKQALTPPTAEEVCEALREHYKHYVCYSEVSNEFMFEDSEKITRHGIYGYQVVVYMPPHLITLIGRFYEGEIK